MTTNRTTNASAMSRPLRSPLLVACFALLVATGPVWATAISSSESVINDITTSTPPESNGTTSSSVSDGRNSASSFLLPAVGTLGAAVSSNGSVVGVRTSTIHDDDWTCGSGASCLVAGPLNVTIDFDAVFSGPGTLQEFSLVARYLVGGSLFALGVSEDGGPATADASWGVDPVDVLLTPDPLTNSIRVSTHFVGQTRLLSCNGTAGPCGIFSDEQLISLEMEGNGFVDASHTFTVSLAPTNPAIFLTSADGRTAGSPVSQVPEPGTLGLLCAGLGVLAASRRKQSCAQRDLMAGALR